MKVLLVNGSPNKNGCTFTALSEVAHTLEEEGVSADIFSHRQQAHSRLFRLSEVYDTAKVYME